MPKKNPAEPMPELTVNGQPIPEHLRHAIAYKDTDQGRAELPEGEHAIVEFLSDPLDKAIAARRDALTDGVPTWFAPDPMGDLAKRYVPEGMSPKFLSPRKVEVEGKRGFEYVRNEKGEPVRLGNLVLGQMPMDKVLQRREHYREMGRKAQAEAVNTFNEQQEQLMRVSDRGSIRSRQDSAGDVGLESITGNSHF